MSKERELLQEALNWMLDLSDIYTDEGPEDDRLLLRLVDDINKTKEFLSQPERGFLSNTEKMELHAKLRQQGSLTQDGCWDAIEVFQKFLQECGIGGPNE